MRLLSGKEIRKQEGDEPAPKGTQTRNPESPGLNTKNKVENMNFTEASLFWGIPAGLRRGDVLAVAQEQEREFVL